MLFRRWWIQYIGLYQGPKILCLLNLKSALKALLSKPLFLLGQKLYTIGAGDMEAFTFQDLCLVIFSSWLGADGMGHLSSALQYHKSSLSSPSLQLSLLGALHGPFIYSPLDYPPPQPYTMGAWHGPSFLFTTVSSVLSNPSFRPSSLQLYKMHHLHPHTYCASFWLLLFFIWYRCRFLLR